MKSAAKAVLEGTLRRLAFDKRTIDAVKFDLRRAWTRSRYARTQARPKETKLQLGAGGRAVPGWQNCDITASQYDVDLAVMPLPFADNHFESIVAQHTIEHLEFDPQVIELFRDCHRMLRPGGKVWFSCPDLEKICAAYMNDRCRTLDRGLKRHWPNAETDGFPVQHRINYYFHQGGEHKNLMDYEMLEWALRHVGFVEVRRGDEAAFLTDYPEFPRRNDDWESVYVTARKAPLQEPA